MGESPGRPRRGRDRPARLEALHGEAAEAIGQKRRLAAPALRRFPCGKEMSAAGYVEKQTERRIERDQRRIAVAPIGDALQECAVGRLVSLGDDEIGMAAAGVCEAHAHRNATAFGNAVRGDDAERALDLRNDRERRSLRKRAASLSVRA
jgi:hypothetical protein